MRADVLFICQANVGRSQMAEAYYNHFRGGKRAMSAGIVDLRKKYRNHPAPEVTELMKEDGIDISAQRITIVDQSLLEKAKQVIVLCDKNLCPQFLIAHPRVQFYPIEDPYQKGVAAMRQIRDQIKKLAAELLASPGGIKYNREQMNRKRVYSGIRATGRLHLGNYLGAVKGMLALQDEYDCVFSVVDLHAITTPYDPTTLRQSTRDIIMDYLAAGLDTSKCFLEVQSKVPEHMELAYYLSTIYPVSRLEDLPTYKDKKAQHPKYVNMGLLYYPVLMAADILLYKAELVPVGKDQEPHLEVAREIARKFNQMFGETFPEPHRFKTEGEYVPSLTGQGKMGKSIEGSYINLSDDRETIKQRLAKVPTDSGTTGGSIPQEGGVASLFTLFRLFGAEELFHKYVTDYREKRIRYSEMKADLAEVIFKELQPIQERRAELEANPTLVDQIIAENAEKCRNFSEDVIDEVRAKMGFPPKMGAV